MMKIQRTCSFAAVAVAVAAAATTTTGTTSTREDTSIVHLDFGVDVSYPIHHNTVSTNYPWLPHNTEPDLNPTPSAYERMPIQPLGNKEEFYKEYMKRCRDHAGEENAARCDSSEAHRILRNLNQPKSMRNFTETGLLKIRAPDDLMMLLSEFWETNRNRKVIEKFHPGHAFMNVFDVPSYIVHVEDMNLPGGGLVLKKKLWDVALAPIRQWTGIDLVPSSLYGIRIYENGAILAPHVDRIPLVSSAIINVAQDVDEDWPLEIIGHDGKARNITMEPGDMVLYESHSIIHGRPYPLKGRFYANVFIHFMPSVRNADELPVYLIPGSPEAVEWMDRLTHNRRDKNGRTPLHEAAEKGDLKSVRKVISMNRGEIEVKDANGWRPLHEAARGGYADVVQYLIENGAEINSRTLGSGGTPLYWALREWGGNHSVVRLLREHGGIDLHPRRMEFDEFGRTSLHKAADIGDMHTVREIVSTDKALVNAEDVNGWRPLHEASRSGHLDVVKFLLDHGADLNARTLEGKGGTALHYAVTKRGNDHPVVNYLMEIGGEALGPIK